MRMWRNWNSCALLVGMKRVQLLWKTIWRFFKKLNIELPYDLETSLLGIHSRGLKAGIQTNYLYTNVHSSTIHNFQKVETA